LGGDVMTGIGFRPFWLRLPGSEPQPPDKFFDLIFYWKPG